MLDFGGVGSKRWRFFFKSGHFFTCCKTFQIYHLANRISRSRLLQGLAVFEYYVVHCHTEKAAHVSLMWCPSLCDSVQNRSAKLFGFLCLFLPFKEMGTRHVILQFPVMLTPPSYLVTSPEFYTQLS